jgi:nitroreductase/NAD-dependent dihydropyrimidine dehydrogenase PreA subunit
MIEIDKDKCTSCSKCFEVCPSGIIESERVDGKRRVYVAQPDWCNLCGHCMAVCEPRAISHNLLSYDDFEELGELDVSADSMKRLLLARRSVRRYKPEPVPDEAVAELIEVATHAGTGGNNQSVGFLVIRDAALIQRLEDAVLDVMWNSGVKFMGNKTVMSALRLVAGSGTAEQMARYYTMFKTMKDRGQLQGSMFRNAPALVVAYDKKSNRMAALDCAIAMRNVEVMAMTMGLGTCWSGFLVGADKMRPKPINGMLGLADDERIHGALMLGYPKYTYNVKLPRKARAVTYL